MSGSVGAVVCGKPDGVERDVATCDGLCVPEALLQDTDRKPAPAARVAGAPRPQVRPSTLPSATPPAARSTDGLQSHTTSTNQESPQDFSALSPLTQAGHNSGVNFRPPGELSRVRDAIDVYYNHTGANLKRTEPEAKQQQRQAGAITKRTEP
jgi:hypothetical protein